MQEQERAVALCSGPSVSSSLCALAVLLTAPVHRPVAGVALGPYQQQQIAIIRLSMNLAHELAGRCCRLPVHLQNHVTGLKTSIICRARRTDVLHDCSLHIVRDLELLPHILRQVANCKTELAALRSTGAVVICELLVIAFIGANRYAHRRRPT